MDRVFHPSVHAYGLNRQDTKADPTAGSHAVQYGISLAWLCLVSCFSFPR